MENKIGRFEFVDCSAIADGCSNEDNDSSGMHSKKQAIGRTAMFDSSDLKQKIPLVKPEPSEQPVVKAEVDAIPLSSNLVDEVKALQMIRRKRQFIVKKLNSQRPILMGEDGGKSRREWRKPQGVNTGEIPSRSERKIAMDCKTRLKEQYTPCETLVSGEAQQNSKLKRSSLSLSSRSSNSELSRGCEVGSKYREKRDKNNLASRRSRLKMKKTLQIMQLEFEKQKAKNQTLKLEIDSLVKFLNKLNALRLRCEKLALEHAQQTSESWRSSLSPCSRNSNSEQSSDSESSSKFHKIREANNLAAKRSRLKRKQALQMVQLKLEEQEAKNRKLKVEVDRLVKFLNKINAVLLRCNKVRDVKARGPRKLNYHVNY